MRRLLVALVAVLVFSGPALSQTDDREIFGRSLTNPAASCQGDRHDPRSRGCRRPDHRDV